MPNYRAVHFSSETAVQEWDGLCWTTIRTFTGEDHAAAGAALVCSLEQKEGGSASLSLFLMLVIPMLLAALAPVMIHAATAMRAAGGAL